LTWLLPSPLADVVMISWTDEFSPSCIATEIEPNLKQGATLAFAHGFAITTPDSCAQDSGL